MLLHTGMMPVHLFPHPHPMLWGFHAVPRQFLSGFRIRVAQSHRSSFCWPSGFFYFHQRIFHLTYGFLIYICQKQLATKPGSLLFTGLLELILHLFGSPSKVFVLSPRLSSHHAFHYSYSMEYFFVEETVAELLLKLQCFIKEALKEMIFLLLISVCLKLSCPFIEICWIFYSCTPNRS